MTGHLSSHPAQLARLDRKRTSTNRVRANRGMEFAEWTIDSRSRNRAPRFDSIIAAQRIVPCYFGRQKPYDVHLTQTLGQLLPSGIGHNLNEIRHALPRPLAAGGVRVDFRGGPARNNPFLPLLARVEALTKALPMHTGGKGR